MRRLLTFAILFFLLSSHELFLKSDTYFLKNMTSAELYLYNGTFDESENTISRDRIIKPKIIGPKYDFTPSIDDYYDRDKITYLKFKTGDEGTYVAGISTKPRTIKLSGQAFTDYLEHEGLSNIISERKTKGISGIAAREKYSKHVKAILQVDEKRTDHFSSKLDYPIEFIPLKNPYALKIGDEMSFKLLYLGKPIANQVVHVSYRNNMLEKENSKITSRTDKNGELFFKITEKGLWYASTIHMLESEEKKLDYESNWGTITFEVK